jgi:hypothetical protein
VLQNEQQSDDPTQKERVEALPSRLALRLLKQLETKQTEMKQTEATNLGEHWAQPDEPSTWQFP